MFKEAKEGKLLGTQIQILIKLRDFLRIKIQVRHAHTVLVHTNTES